ncbi:imm11 family protein [Cystobacter fuscus]|uniref:imm11 family protein n=1 Tax=Cystobacter fuscus TaxID=43 RepID=UPI0037BE6225
MKLAGQPLDFSQAAFGIPIVHVRVESVFIELAKNDVQFFPVEIEGCSDQYRILNVTRVVKCIDDHASEEVRYWKPEDGRPEKTGQYRAVYGLRIAPSKVDDAKVFRTWGWTVALIVSEQLKDALESVGATGTKFKEV